MATKVYTKNTTESPCALSAFFVDFVVKQFPQKSLMKTCLSLWVQAGAEYAEFGT